MPNPNHCICVTKPYPTCPIHGDKAKHHHSYVPILSDDDLALSMFVFIEQYGDRMIKATSQACGMVADKANKELDGTSEDIWRQTQRIVGEAATALEADVTLKNGCPGCGGVCGCWCNDERMKGAKRL